MGGCVPTNRQSRKDDTATKLPPSPEMLRRESVERMTTSHQNIRRVYKFDPKVIGHGNFGVVRIAYLLSNQHKKFAVKTISKEKIRRDFHLFARELETLRSMDHPNIVRFYETYQDQKYFHIVMEYCSGGELLERIAEKSTLTELEARKIMAKIFSAVKYLHDKKICHRDLKPDNFLFSSRSPDGDIKLIDFGLAREFGVPGFKYLTTVVGTPMYFAPEVYEARYDEKCDYWSLGVILYVLLSGNPPYRGSSNVEIYREIKKGKLEFTDKAWERVSESARDLITRLLVIDPKKRMTAEEALEHPWLKEHAVSQLDSSGLDPKIFNMLKNFRSSAKLRKEALRVMVNMLSEKEIKAMRRAFKIIDKDNSGEITFEELKQVMTELGFKDIEHEIEEIMLKLHVDSRAGINYSDFLSATLDSKIYLNKEKLWATFKYFDVRNLNYITIESLREAMARAGKKVEEKELREMIAEFDESQDGQISFDEFVKMMKMESNENTEEVSPDQRRPRKESVDDIKEFRGIHGSVIVEKAPLDPISETPISDQNLDLNEDKSPTNTNTPRK